MSRSSSLAITILPTATVAPADMAELCALIHVAIEAMTLGDPPGPAARVPEPDRGAGRCTRVIDPEA